MKAAFSLALDKLCSPPKQMAERIRQLEARATPPQRKHETRRKLLLEALVSA